MSFLSSAGLLQHYRGHLAERRQNRFTHKQFIDLLTQMWRLLRPKPIRWLSAVAYGIRKAT